jgi:hypothetical protein
MDRETLFDSVLDETQRHDLEAELPGMLLRAEAKIARELRCEEMSATDTLDTSSGAANLPDDYLGMRAVFDSNGPFQQVGLMEYRSSADLRRVYAIVGRQLLCRADEVEIEYFARPAPLADDADTNDVLDAHPDLYLELLCFYVQKRAQDLELAQGCMDVYADARDTLNELADRQRGAARLGKPYSFAARAAY